MSPPAARASQIVTRLVDRARGGGPLPVVVCVDVEPDPRVVSSTDPPPWAGFARFVERLPALRARLAAATGAPAALTWCLRMDPQITALHGSPEWLADAFGPQLEELRSAGDVFGVHTHPWRRDRGSELWYADFDDQDWGTACLRMGLDAFERAFGRPCVVHRGGDHYLSAAMFAVLEESGVVADLTVEPGRHGRGVLEGETSRGDSSDFRGVPTAPYRSSPRTFPSPDPTSFGGPLLIPLMSSIGRRFARITIPPNSSPTRFIPRLELELARGTAPVLAFAVRTESSLGIRWEWLERNLAHLARHRGIRFVTATAAASRAT